tara:strand:+ start:7282 stop:7653 length:372 start_codon:yes stop_codon:yes gene_type:complete
MNERYNQILSNEGKQIRIPNLNSYVPKPKDKDYEIGYIKRYFAQKVNDESSPIVEISATSYQNLSNSPYYNRTDIRWKISGLLESRGHIIGVKQANSNSILRGCKDLKNLKNYLLNTQQFYKS